MKRIFAAMLVFSMLFALFPLNSFAETYSGTCGDNLTWTLDTETGTLTISGEGEMTMYHYMSKAPWYEYGSYIESLVIEKEVTSIGDYAFRGCDLKSITFHEESELVSIGACAFLWCTYLESINFPKKLTSIGNEAFCDCEKITNIYIPESITSIGKSAFAYCESLEKIIVDENNIVFYSSNNCVIERESKTLVLGCKNSIIPDEIISIGDKAFRACIGLKTVNIPDGVTYIGKNAFDDCENLTSIELPDGITSIADYTFSGCESLNSVTIGNNVTSIGKESFYNCRNLTTVYYGGTEEEWYAIDIGDYNYYLLNAEIIFKPCDHAKGTWKVLEDGTKEKVCNNCGEVIETLGADEFIPNDINGDNKFDMFDYVSVKNCVMKGTTDEALKARCDVNGDGKVNIFDYVAIKAAYFAQ